MTLHNKTFTVNRSRNYAWFGELNYIELIYYELVQSRADACYYRVGQQILQSGTILLQSGATLLQIGVDVKK